MIPELSASDGRMLHLRQTEREGCHVWERRRDGMETSFDVVVVGAGLAGLAAGATAARAGRRVLIVDGHSAGRRARGRTERVPLQPGRPCPLPGRARRSGPRRSRRRRSTRRLAVDGPVGRRRQQGRRCRSRPARPCGRRCSTRSARRSWHGSCARSARSILDPRRPQRRSVADRPGPPARSHRHPPHARPRGELRRRPDGDQRRRRRRPDPAGDQRRGALPRRRLAGVGRRPQQSAREAGRRYGSERPCCSSPRETSARASCSPTARRSAPAPACWRSASGCCCVRVARTAGLGSSRPTDDGGLPRPRPAPAAAKKVVFGVGEPLYLSTHAPAADPRAAGRAGPPHAIWRARCSHRPIGAVGVGPHRRDQGG